MWRQKNTKEHKKTTDIREKCVLRAKYYRTMVDIDSNKLLGAFCTFSKVLGNTKDASLRVSTMFVSSQKRKIYIRISYETPLTCRRNGLQSQTKTERAPLSPSSMKTKMARTPYRGQTLRYAQAETHRSVCLGILPHHRRLVLVQDGIDHVQHELRDSSILKAADHRQSLQLLFQGSL